MFFNNRDSQSLTLGNYREMEAKAPQARKPLIILSVIFLIVVVVVGAVVWKVTKDAYNDDDVTTLVVGDNSNNKTTGEGGGDKDDDKEKEEISEEELLRSPWKRLRLPRNILPVHYDITMYPNFYDEMAEFHGNETIHLTISSPSKYLFIHIDTNIMNITDTKVHDKATGNEVSIRRTFIYKPNEFFVIEAEEDIVDDVLVSLQFQGSLNISIVGIYKSSYVNSLTNKTSYLATSKFEPTYARRAFPCLDEPNMKATYTITLIHRDGYTALSNMDVDEETTADFDPQLKATKFQRSVKMSTYLVCFIVCDFESVSATSKKGKTIRVFATPDKMDQTAYALEMAKYTLDHYEDVFKIDYPLPKQDLIAIPDFVSGAMEHWGLITFRETALLYHPNSSTLANKKRVATVVAHEMAHMWFGNLVTMDWWNDLWLNEGFASYMEYTGIEDKEKDWNMDAQFLTADLLPVMDDDSVISSHPIVVTVRDPSEITSVFDAISYSKGASVIRMLDGIMGSKNFFQGVADYLKKFMWGNARTDDLWQSLAEADPSTHVKSIMDTWTIQDGFPYVNITMTTTGSGDTTIHATQKRFMSDPNAQFDEKSSPFGYKWYISLDYNTSAGIGDTEVMNRTDVEFDVAVDLSQNDSWIKFNKDKKGFYIVLYPDAMWTQLADHLSTQEPEDWKLSPSDRADLLNDAFQLASAGMTSYSVPLSLSQYLSKEAHSVPWAAAVSGGLSYIGAMLKDDPDYGTWKNWRAPMVRSSLAKLGYNDDGTFLEKQLRKLLFSMACSDGDDAALAVVESQFRQWLDKGEQPSNVNIRGAIYTHGMGAFGTDEDWARVWSKYLVESLPSEKDLLLSALTNTKKSHLVAKLLDYAMRGEGIRRQDFFTTISRLGANSFAQPIVWDWMREHYTEMEQRFGVRDRYFGRMAYYLARHFKTRIRLQEVKSFFSQHPDEGSSTRYRKMALEDINRRIYWMEHFRPEILQWVKTNMADKTTTSV